MRITIETCELIENALSSGVSREELKSMLIEILSAHRPMALLFNCINRFMSGGNVREFMEEMKKKNEDAGKKAGEYLKEKGMRRALTISSSSAVESALSYFDGEIYVMESRPMLEGTAMAERLAKKGKDVRVVTDAYGISMAAKGEVDAVLVGADAIYRDMLINKVGTYALSVAAEKSGIDFIAVLTTDKIFPPEIELPEKELMQFHDPKEITDKVRAENPYFEWVPIRRNMRVFTEEVIESMNEKNN